MTLLALTVALAALPPRPVDADIVCLKDGRVVQGPKMERKDGGIELTYPHGTVFLPKDMISDAVLAADATAAPATDEDREMASKGLVKFDGKWVPTARRDELIGKRLAEKRKELEQVEARKEWRNRGKQETAHFRFEYTVPDSILEGYRDTMEAYFQEFSKAWKLPPTGKDDRLPVCFHGSEETFHQVSGAGYGVLGWFRPIKPYELNIYYERLDPALSTEVMFHESNHYLQRLLDAEFLMPHFPGESLAEYYGSSLWDPAKKKLTVGVVNEIRLSEVQEDISRGEMMELDRMLKTERMYEHYTWGWSLVYFLMNDPKYQPKFQKFVMALVKGKGTKRPPIGIKGLKSVEGEEVERVFLSELGLKDAAATRKLESDWHDFVKNLKPATLRGTEEAGISAAAHGRPIRALRLLKEAADKGSTNTLVYHRYAQALYAKGRGDEAIAMWRKAIELDPLNGAFYANIGYAMIHPRNKASGGKEDESDEKKEGAATTGGDKGAGSGAEGTPPSDGKKDDGTTGDGASTDGKPQKDGKESGAKDGEKKVAQKNPEGERLIELGKDLGYDSPFLELSLKKSAEDTEDG